MGNLVKAVEESDPPRSRLTLINDLDHPRHRFGPVIWKQNTKLVGIAPTTMLRCLSQMLRSK
ncbi:UNVERIFIED_CONTAM: hypothetical protein Sindi_1866000, partial [Sesamum indicum]